MPKTASFHWLRRARKINLVGLNKSRPKFRKLLKIRPPPPLEKILDPPLGLIVPLMKNQVSVNIVPQDRHWSNSSCFSRKRKTSKSCINTPPYRPFPLVTALSSVVVHLPADHCLVVGSDRFPLASRDWSCVGLFFFQSINLGHILDTSVKLKSQTSIDVLR